MSIAWFLLISVYCAISVVGFDLGPIIRTGQCRSECLRKHSINGSRWYSNSSESVCRECWQSCEALENTKENARTICKGDQYQHCLGCQTACAYHNTRVAEKYEPSMLPGPNKGPVSLDPHDVAVVLYRGVHQQWQVSRYYHGDQRLNLTSKFTWIIVITEDGLRHYSWQEWVPTLDSLKEGPLFEATISWRDIRLQQRWNQRKPNNDQRMYLERSGEKVLAEHSHKDSRRTIERDVFRRFFFKRRNDADADETEKLLGTNGDSPSTGNDDLFVEDETSGAAISEDGSRSSKKQSFVVSWGPEAGGLTGNQVTDGNTAQISLLPGTTYLVRVASNDGPGSFPIIVDTRPTAGSSSSSSLPSFSPVSSSSSLPSFSPVSVCRVENHWDNYFWHLFAINIIILVAMLGFFLYQVIICEKAMSSETMAEKV